MNKKIKFRRGDLIVSNINIIDETNGSIYIRKDVIYKVVNVLTFAGDHIYHILNEKQVNVIDEYEIEYFISFNEWRDNKIERILE